MPERDAHDPDPAAPHSGPPATPRVSGEVLASAADSAPPRSNTGNAQAEEVSAASEPSDTLLSAGKPADRLEIRLEDRIAVVDARLREVDERLREVDERLRDVDTRLHVLEQKKSIGAPEPRQKPLLWIAFLIALVVVFQLLRRVR